jgi:hypothetical protein
MYIPNDPKWRFERKFTVKESGCWEWTDTLTKKGHGKFWINDMTHSANRVSMHLYRNFDLNSEDCVLHKCDNASCVNPDHLYIGSLKDNTKDTIAAGNHNNARKTHCPQGHEYAIGNTLYRRNGDRYCRICSRERTAKYRASKNARNNSR